MQIFRLNPQQYLFIESVLNAQTVPLLEAEAYVGFCKSLSLARQAGDGLVDISFEDADVARLIEYIMNHTCKFKDTPFISEVVRILREEGSSPSS